MGVDVDGIEGADELSVVVQVRHLRCPIEDSGLYVKRGALHSVLHLQLSLEEVAHEGWVCLMVELHETSVT